MRHTVVRDTRDHCEARRHAPAVWRRRFGWCVVALFAFLAFEAVLVAIALQGAWLVLLAPGVVCGIKAAESYRGLRDSQTRHPQDPTPSAQRR